MSVAHVSRCWQSPQQLRWVPVAAAPTVPGAQQQDKEHARRRLQAHPERPEPELVNRQREPLEIVAAGARRMVLVNRRQAASEALDAPTAVVAIPALAAMVGHRAVVAAPAAPAAPG